VREKKRGCPCGTAERGEVSRKGLPLVLSRQGGNERGGVGSWKPDDFGERELLKLALDQKAEGSWILTKGGKKKKKKILKVK